MDIRKIIKEEIDDLEWAREAVSGLNINIGDVFYVVDNNNPQKTNPSPDDYQPTDARYVLTIADIIPDEKGGLIIKYKPCDPENTTYNAKDYSIESSRCYDYEDPESEDADKNGYEDVSFKWFTEELIPSKYWCKMK